MAVTMEMHNTGHPAQRAEVVSVIEHVLSDRPGDWQVSIVGSQANDGWELKIIGPNAFERSYAYLGHWETELAHRRVAVRVARVSARRPWAWRAVHSVLCDPFRSREREHLYRA